MKKLILVILFSSLSWAENSSTSFYTNRHSTQQLPYMLVVDAGVLASRQASEHQVQFVRTYALAVREALIYGLKESVKESFMDYKRACESTDDKQLRAISCGYVAGINAFKNKELRFDLLDFGYIKTSITGLIISERNILKTAEKEIWLVNTPTDKVKNNKCYLVEGYLSREGSYGPRGIEFEREFIATSTNKVEPGVCR